MAMKLTSEHQIRLWRRMIDLIRQYREGEIGVPRLVEGLLGTFEAGDIVDQSIREEWYAHWTPLETIRAMSGDSATIADVDRYLVEFEGFLEAVVQKAEEARR